MLPEEGMNQSRVVPLFPLNVVLFPGQALPLHIFEPRYRLMIDHCLVERLPFAVNLIQSGQEVGGQAEPFATGTLAEISDVARLPDGRMHILVTGSRRVRLVEQVSGEPYAQARIEILPEGEAEVPLEVLAKARALFSEYAQTLLKLANVPVAVQFPDDPAEASYVIASMLQTDLFTKQALLELPGAGERLAQEVRLLETEVGRLKEFADVMGDKGFFFYRGKRFSLN
jgi:Lon protease-like protein